MTDQEFKGSEDTESFDELDKLEESEISDGMTDSQLDEISGGGYLDTIYIICPRCHRRFPKSYAGRKKYEDHMRWHETP